MGLEGEDEGVISMFFDNIVKLILVVSFLLEFFEKKRFIDFYINVVIVVLEYIKVRKLDVYFEYEEKIMSKIILDKFFLDIILDFDVGILEDKMRLFFIYYISI